MPGNDDAALMLADRVLGRRAEYGRRVERVHTASLLLAERLAAGGDVERALLGHLGGGEGKGDCDGDGEGGRAAMAAFLDGQRGRLRALAERNGGRMREVDAFVAGVAKIRDGMLSRQQGQQQTQLHGQAAPSPEEEEGEEEKEKGGGGRGGGLPGRHQGGDAGPPRRRRRPLRGRHGPRDAPEAGGEGVQEEEGPGRCRRQRQ